MEYSFFSTVFSIIQRQWGLDAHVLSYHADQNQEADEKGWRLFEVEAHDASWIPTRLIPTNHHYRSSPPPERYCTREGNRGVYDAKGHFEYMYEQPQNKNQKNEKKKKAAAAAAEATTLCNEVEIPLHGADWMALDVAVGVGGLDTLDVSSTSRDPLSKDWHEIRELRY